MTKKQLRKEIKYLRQMVQNEIDVNLCVSKNFYAEIKENEILKQSLASCENALREKEVIITYLETKGN